MAFDLRSNKNTSNPYGTSSDFKAYKQESDSSTLSTRRTFIESRRSKSEEVDEAEGWVLTYADMVTLLLTFFVLLFSFSTIDQSKFEQMKSAISGEMLKKEVEKPFEEITIELQSIIEERKLENTVSVETDPLGVKIELASSSLYELGSAAIKRDMTPVISEVGKAIQLLNLDDFLIEVQGHTDDIPIKSPKYESNWELSSHRATNVVKLFIEAGIPAVKLKASGFADSRPLAPNKDVNGISISSNQEKNRRVVVFVRRNFVPMQ